MTGLTLRTVFRLDLRQTERFVGSLMRVLGLALGTPDHSAVSRRSRAVGVRRLARGDAGPLHLVIDSTGLKLCGSGEWQAHEHETSGPHRRWRKLHLGVDAHGFVIASALTDSGADQAPVGVSLLEQVEAAVARSMADGAHDRRGLYEAAAAVGADGRGHAAQEGGGGRPRTQGARRMTGDAMRRASGICGRDGR